MSGPAGRALVVDVGSGRAEVLDLDPALLRLHVGGVGLGARLLADLAPAGVDPLSPAAPLVLAVAPLVGTGLTTTAKLAVVAKSPLTGLLNDALVSSGFAVAVRRAGWDAVVLVGARTEPGVVVVDDGAVRVEAAGALWGRPAADAEAALRARLGRDHHVAAIGPAGERLVRYATLSHDGRHAGRGGHGAVLGAKGVKAVAVRGTGAVAVADPAAVDRHARSLRRRAVGPATAKYRELGTLANLLAFDAVSTLPTRNFQAARHAGAEALAAERLATTHGERRTSCAACNIGCDHGYRRPGGGRVRLEYESAFALGPLLGLVDPDAVLEAAARCDELGLDTISAGGTLAWAMESVERGVLDAPWLRFGDGAAVLRALDLVARREGLGDLLADGSRAAAGRVGGGSDAWAAHVKGLELPGYEPRTLQASALGLAVAARGADHNRSGAYEVDFGGRHDRLHGGLGHVAAVVDAEDRAAAIDSLVLCKFLRGVFTEPWSEWAELVAAVTGWDMDGDELRAAARRTVTLRRLVNVREGATAADDRLPARFHDETLTMASGREAALPRERLAAMVAGYYAARGWDPAGVPAPATVAALGLGGVAA